MKDKVRVLQSSVSKPCVQIPYPNSVSKPHFQTSYPPASLEAGAGTGAETSGSAGLRIEMMDKIQLFFFNVGESHTRLKLHRMRAETSGSEV